MDGIMKETAISEDGMALKPKGSHETNPFASHKRENARVANLSYYVDPLLRLAIKYDFADELMWRIDKHGLFTAAIMCSDMFYWGTADGEDVSLDRIPLLEKAYEDCSETQTGMPLPDYWGSTLFCCRVRKMRVQGAVYTSIEKELWPLFNAVGPEREIGVGNPYEPGEYHPGDMTEADKEAGE